MVESARETSRLAHGNTGAGTIASSIDRHAVTRGNCGEVGTLLRHWLARDAREESALGAALGVRGSDTLSALGTSVEALVQVRSTSSLAEASLR